MGTMAERFIGMGRNTSTSSATSGAPNIDVEINTEAVRRHLDDIGRMLTTNNETRDRIRAIIKEEIKAARSRISKDIHASLPNDPRKAFRAVRSSIYKKVFGGNINILTPRKAGAKYMLTRLPKLNPGQRGGNRRARSGRTIALETYFGKDRGFILRFQNSGTTDRKIKFTSSASRKVDKWNHNPNSGNRGNIAPRGVFSQAAVSETDALRAAISQALEQEFVDIWNE